MESKKYTYILYLILVTILATIAIQVYWNIGNYKTNKQTLINEVQNSFDNSVEAYYANLAKTDFFTFLDRDTLNFKKKEGFVSIIQSDSIINIDIKQEKGEEAIRQVLEGLDSAKIRIKPRRPLRRFARMHFLQKKMRDSSGPFRKLFNRLITSASSQNLDFSKLDSLLNRDLMQKQVELAYELNYFEDDSLVSTISRGQAKSYPLTAVSKSNYLVDFQKLELNYNNPVLAILKRSLTGIVLSLLLSGCIIYSLFYLLRTIRKQKQLSEIKNDLINNITHEFKTPIATVSTAIEGIKNFNALNDTSKTEKYLDISQQQLKKLHTMVEKLLETATLDSERLVLEKEPHDLAVLIGSVVDRFKLMTEKTIVFKNNSEKLVKEVDPFHFENVISNILDNAIKYGGDRVEVSLDSILDKSVITIADNGKGIGKKQQDKIFDKFYRVPTGNQHDVKGFGIGLFYAKKIVEKHAGNLTLVPDTSYTIFKIEL
ncbi:sensor histidine kinase [Flagellimonas sp.]|uniref:sensor histidine kinase n=1 Tax=Flagellimonas sp. TaxID=2058762 RepID=UPI003F49DFBD